MAPPSEFRYSCLNVSDGVFSRFSLVFHIKYLTRVEHCDNEYEVFFVGLFNPVDTIRCKQRTYDATVTINVWFTRCSVTTLSVPTMRAATGGVGITGWGRAQSQRFLFDAR